MMEKVFKVKNDGKSMKEAKAINSIIVAHCEDEGELEKGACINLGRVSKENGLVGINNASEYNHALRDLQLSKEIGNRYHICHISTKETVAGLREISKTRTSCFRRSLSTSFDFNR